MDLTYISVFLGVVANVFPNVIKQKFDVLPTLPTLHIVDTFVKISFNYFALSVSLLGRSLTVFSQNIFVFTV